MKTLNHKDLDKYLKFHQFNKRLSLKKEEKPNIPLSMTIGIP